MLVIKVDFCPMEFERVSLLRMNHIDRGAQAAFKVSVAINHHLATAFCKFGAPTSSIRTAIHTSSAA
jgi:hypothetical protein